jgi:hypothetical protein
MGEAEMSRAAGNVRDDPGRHCFVERVEQLILRYAAEARKRVERELPAKHGGHHQQAVALFGEVGKSASDDVVDALGDCEPNLGSGFGPNALDGEETHDLANEKRIPFGLLVQRRDELRRGDLRRSQLDIRRHVPLAQAAEREVTGHRLAGKVSQHRGQRLSGSRIDASVGAEQK